MKWLDRLYWTSVLGAPGLLAAQELYFQLTRPPKEDYFSGPLVMQTDIVAAAAALLLVLALSVLLLALWVDTRRRRIWWRRGLLGTAALTIGVPLFFWSMHRFFPLTGPLDLQAAHRPSGTVYWGGSGLEGEYVHGQVRALQAAGIGPVYVGLTNSGVRVLGPLLGPLWDAARSVLVLRHADEAGWTLDGRAMAATAGQFNLVGYSYGSLLAAQTAWSYARRGQDVDHLVLVGSPIARDFLEQLRSHPRIRHVWVIDLSEHGDPIHAGMRASDLIRASLTLHHQLLQARGNGHFYYAQVIDDSEQRWHALAHLLAQRGLR